MAERDSAAQEGAPDPRVSRKPPGTSDERRPRNRSPARETTDPYLALDVGDHVRLSSPLVDPVHWQSGELLWRDDAEILVRTSNFAGKPEKHLREVRDVRVFGTRDHCRAEHQRAIDTVRDAATVSREVEDMTSELRRKMVDLFEAVAAAALKTSAGASA